MNIFWKVNTIALDLHDMRLDKKSIDGFLLAEMDFCWPLLAISIHRGATLMRL